MAEVFHNNAKRISNSRKIILMLYEFSLCLFIILSPIYKNLNDIKIFNYNIIISVIGLLLIIGVLNFFILLKTSQRLFFSPLILLILIFEIVIQRQNGQRPIIGIFLGIVLFVQFLQTDVKISLKKIYLSFFISTIIAAIYSIFLGFSQNQIYRVATFVDGSISPISLVIALFAVNSRFNLDKIYNLIRRISIFASLIVTAFGMSRARIVIIIVLVFIYYLRKSVFYNRKTTFLFLLSILLTPFIIIGIFQIPVVHDLAMINIDRFDYGFRSIGREDEIIYAISLFRNNKMIGAGWGGFIFSNSDNSLVGYDNHNMYVAILARGGLLMGLAFLITYVSLIKNIYKLRKKNFLLVMMLLVLLLLSYGNAGIFNYTICSLTPILALNIKREEIKLNGKKNYLYN